MELLNKKFEVKTMKSKEYTFEVTEAFRGIDVYAKIGPTKKQQSPDKVTITVKKGTKIVRRLPLKDVAFAIGREQGTYKVTVKNENPLKVSGTVKVVSV